MKTEYSESTDQQIPTYGDACKCPEKQKPFPQRNWMISFHVPYKAWGGFAHNYVHRMFIVFDCKTCGAHWKNKNRRSPIWKHLGFTCFDFAHRDESIMIKDLKK